MKLAIMQPYFFPYIGYFQLIQAVDKFVIYDDVNFIKKGWINRNNILLNGKAHLFSLPISNISQNKKINELVLADNKSWQRKFFSMLELSYTKAPYYKDVLILLARIFNYQSKCVADFITHSLKEVCSYLDIATEVVSSSSIYTNTHLTGQNRIIDICLQEKTSTYINAAGGKELYDKSSFLEKKIDLKFLNGTSLEYTQFEKEFVSGLSIIDVLMFNSKDRVINYLQNYRLD